jgi:nucleoside-diphosphate-sugar epimerase
MKIAVTGASGFIGKQVLTTLLKHGVDIVAVARDTARLTGFSEVVRIIEMDIAHQTSNCFEQLGRPDVLIHLAWDGLPNYKSLHHFDTELPKQYHFLKTVIEAGLPSLLVTGTCFEYGMQSGALDENVATLPSNPYGFAKDALRCQLQYLQQLTPFSFTWARLFYLYGGEGQAKTSLLPQIIQAVECGQKVFNMSGGEQLRDYLPITEVANYLVTLALNEGNTGIVNVCSGKPISVRKLVESWINKNDWSIDLNLGYYPYPDYEPMAFWGDRGKLDQCLGLK